MQFATLLTAVATIAIGAADAAAIRRDGARLAQFRVFGADGCSALNYGFYTVDQSDIGVCNTLTTDPTAVTSVNLEHLESPAADGCSGKSSSCPLASRLAFHSTERGRLTD